MGPEGVNVPAQSQALTGLGDKQVSQLVGADYKLTVTSKTDVKASGTVHNIADAWTQFDSREGKNTGHFAVIGFPKFLQGEKIVLGGLADGDKTISEMDDLLVLRLENMNEPNKLTVKHNDKIVMNVDFTGVKKEGV